jgi:PAS domain S-box-containing protein
MYQLLTELVKLVREQPGIFPVLFGGLLVLVNVPGLPWFLSLDPVHCELLTDLGLLVMAVGFATLFFKRLTSTQSASLRDVSKALEDLSGSLNPDGQLTAVERIDSLETAVDDVESMQGRLLDMSPVPYYESDARGRVIYVNKAYTDLYGVSAATLLNDQPLTWVHPRERSRVYRDALMALENQGGYTIKARITSHGRDRCKVVFRGSPLFNDDDEFCGHYGVVEVLEDYRGSS